MRKVPLATIVFSCVFLVFMAFSVMAQPPVAKEAKDKTEEAIKEMRLENFTKAAALLEEALRFTKYYPEAQINLCTCYFQLQRYDDAKQMCDMAIKSAPNLRAQPYVILGDIFYKEENHEESINNLNKAATIDKKSTVIFNLLGLNYLKLNELEKAIENFSEAAKYDPKNFEANFYLANTLYLMGRLRESQTAYEKCVAINSKNPVVYYKLATSYLDDKNFEKAIDTYNRFLKISPNNISTHLRLGEIYDSTGDSKTAIISYENAVKIDASQPSPYLAMAKIQARIGETEQARTNFDKAISLNSLMVEAYRERGKLHLKLGQLDDAKSDFLEATRIDPSAEEGFHSLAIVLGKSNDNAAAAENFEKALSIEPTFGLAHFGLARLALKQDRFEDAITSYSEALKTLPDRLDILNERGVAYYRSGQRDKALEDWNAVLARQKDYPSTLINKAIDIISTDGDVDAAFQLIDGIDANRVPAGSLDNTRAMITIKKDDAKTAGPILEDVIRTLPDRREPLVNAAIVDLIGNTPDKAKQKLDKAKGLPGQYDQAITRYQAYIALLNRQPDEVISLFGELPADKMTAIDKQGIGWAQLTKKDYNAAIQTFSDLLASSPNDYLLLNNLAFAYFQKGQFPEAVTALKKALTAKPDHKQLSLNLASVYYAQGQFNESIKIVQGLGASADTPGSDRHLANLYFDRGVALAQQRKYSQALSEFQKAAEIIKDSAALLCNVGAMHLQLDESEKAKSFFDQGLALDSGCPECLANLGIYYERAGSFRDAFQNFQSFLKQASGDTKTVAGWVDTYKRVYLYE